MCVWLDYGCTGRAEERTRGTHGHGARRFDGGLPATGRRFAAVKPRQRERCRDYECRLRFGECGSPSIYRRTARNLGITVPPPWTAAVTITADVIEPLIQ
uniref:Uncharacterized protein n=1 Tax=Sipha flava TaxID=143950 RepID=A0A2S2R8J8_9HEMI